MFLVLASILLGYQTLLCDASVITLRPAPAAAENTNMKSINVLKEHLRRNNDDYKASLDRPNNKAPVETVPEEIDKNTGNELQNRRGLDLGIGEIIDSVFNFTSTIAKTKKLVKVTQKSEPSPTKQKSESSRYPKYVNKEKGDKASKSRVKYSQSPKQLLPSVSTSLPPIPPPVPRPALRAALAMAPDSQEESASTAEEKVEGVHMRADLTQNLDSSDEIARVPNPYELDMAPAKGGRVQDLRSKNRLCFRHVMIPEGPKYDSKGAVYLREYEPVNERDYPATRTPSVLLPRCCNCCRKSVLGCE